MSGLHVLAVDDEPRALADVQRLLEGSPRVEQVDTAGRRSRGARQARRGLLRRPLPRRAHAGDRGPRARAAAAALRRPARRRVPHRARRRRGRGVRGAGARLPRQARDAGPPRRGADADRGLALEPRRGRGTQRRAPPRWSRSTIPSAPASASCGWRRSATWTPTATTRASTPTTASSCCAPRSASSRRTGARAGFTRVHRAHLVNLNHAVELRSQPNGTAVLAMRDGTEIPVARRTVAALRRRLKA